MKYQSIFINFPWSYSPGNEILVTSDQVKEAFKIISQSFRYRIKYEMEMEKNNQAEANKYNLNDIVVFNSFVDQTNKNILDPVANEYIMKCIRQVRDCKYTHTCKISFQTMYNIFCKSELKQELFAEFLASNPKKFVNFLRLFQTGSKTALNTESKEIKEILTEYNKYCNKYVNNIRS